MFHNYILNIRKLINKLIYLKIALVDKILYIFNIHSKIIILIYSNV